MAWVDSCQTADDVRILARATEARRKASWAKPKALPIVELPSPPRPVPEPQSLYAYESSGLTVAGAPVKTSLAVVLEYARQVREMNPRGFMPVYPQKPPQIQRIVAETARYFGLSIIDVLSPRRTNGVVRARQIAMYLAKILTTKSLPEVGRRVGGRDHTTVLHAVRKIAALIEHDADLAADVAAVKAKIEAGR